MVGRNCAALYEICPIFGFEPDVADEQQAETLRSPTRRIAKLGRRFPHTYLLHGGTRDAVCDVLRDGAGEEHGVLAHDANV